MTSTQVSATAIIRNWSQVEQEEPSGLIGIPQTLITNNLSPLKTT